MSRKKMFEFEELRKLSKNGLDDGTLQLLGDSRQYMQAVAHRFSIYDQSFYRENALKLMTFEEKRRYFETRFPNMVSSKKRSMARLLLKKISKDMMMDLGEKDEMEEKDEVKEEKKEKEEKEEEKEMEHLSSFFEMLKPINYEQKGQEKVSRTLQIGPQYHSYCSESSTTDADLTNQQSSDAAYANTTQSLSTFDLESRTIDSTIEQDVQ